MPRKSNSRAAAGSGSIRKRPDGRWEARFSYLDELGQNKRASMYAATQKECRKMLTNALKSVDDRVYRKEKRYTVSEWLDEWVNTYCKDLKPSTIAGYKNKSKLYLKPRIGKLVLSELTNVQIQKLYNRLKDGDKKQKPLSPKSIQNVHGILHKALEQAVTAGIIVTNPADNVRLPKVNKPELNPLMDDDISRFLNAIKGDFHERLFIVSLFSGLRMSEMVGLQWEDVDLNSGTLHVHRQIQKAHDGPGYVFLDTTKNGKNRIAAIAPSIVTILRQQRSQQLEWKLAAGSLWNNERNLVFTNEIGEHLKHRTIQNHFKKIVNSLGMKTTRFHDLRHSYAINALQAGDSIKAVQEQLGHYSSAFTMDVYVSVSDTMRKQSQNRMEALFQSVSNT